jgi:antitoxin component of MazEF toxin-antitoxin module
MRLQKQVSRKVGDKEYSKWVIVIPPNEVKELGWKDGEELQFGSQNGKLVVKTNRK